MQIHSFMRVSLKLFCILPLVFSGCLGAVEDLIPTVDLSLSVAKFDLEVLPLVQEMGCSEIGCHPSMATHDELIEDTVKIGMDAATSPFALVQEDHAGGDKPGWDDIDQRPIVQEWVTFYFDTLDGKIPMDEMMDPMP